MYVGDLESKNVSVVGNGKQVETFRVGFGPVGILYCPVDKNIYVGHWLDDYVSSFVAKKV